MSLVRTASQIAADVAAAGGELDNSDGRALPPSSGARARALNQLAREYPDRFAQLYDAEMQALGGESRRMARDRKAALVDRIRHLAGRKLTDREIGDAVGLDRAAVAHLRRRNGIPPGLGRVGRPPRCQSDRGHDLARRRELAPSATRPYPTNGSEADGSRG